LSIEIFDKHQTLGVITYIFLPKLKNENV